MIREGSVWVMQEPRGANRFRHGEWKVRVVHVHNGWVTVDVIRAHGQGSRRDRRFRVAEGKFLKQGREVRG